MNNDLRKVSCAQHMLTGNINRMCSSTTIEELCKASEYAAKRLDDIFRVNLKRVLGDSYDEIHYVYTDQELIDMTMSYEKRQRLEEIINHSNGQKGE